MVSPYLVTEASYVKWTARGMLRLEIVEKVSKYPRYTVGPMLMGYNSICFYEHTFKIILMLPKSVSGAHWPSG